MKYLSAVLLMSPSAGRKVQAIAMRAGVVLDAVIANDPDALERGFSTRRDLLFAFGTGVIVPAWILEKSGLLALNVHAASPQYPGRDPHHFAIYDETKRYGATIHYMVPSVDAGPIVDVELFDVPPNITPVALLELADQAGWELIERFFQKFITDGAPKPILGISWSSRKSTRKLFLELCRIDPAMPKDEIVRRDKATSMPGYSNLYVDIKGYRFRLDGRPT